MAGRFAVVLSISHGRASAPCYFAQLAVDPGGIHPSGRNGKQSDKRSGIGIPLIPKWGGCDVSGRRIQTARELYPPATFETVSTC